MPNFYQKNINAENNLTLSDITAETRVDQIVYVRKNPAPGQFSSVKAAVESINDASANKRYVVQVGPGVYAEQPFTLQEYITITGKSILTTKLEIVDPDSDFITMKSESIIEELTISGTSNTSTVVYSPTPNSDDSRLRGVQFTGNMTNLVDITEDLTKGRFIFERCRADSNSNFDIAVKVSATNFEQSVIIDDWLFEDVSLAPSGTILDVTGVKSSVFLSSFKTSSTTNSGIALNINDGASVKSSDVTITDYDTGIKINGGGAPCQVQMNGTSIPDTSNPIVITDANATGYISGVWENENVSTNAASVALAAASPSNSFYVNTKEVDVRDANVVRVRKDPGPNDFSSIKAAVDSISDASLTNQYVVTVGPGSYTEPTITMKPYITISGLDRNAIIVTVDDPDTYLFESSGQSAITGLTLEGGTGTGGTIDAKDHAGGSIFFVRNCTFGEATTVVNMEATVFSQITLFTCFGDSAFDFDTCFSINGSGINALAVISFNFQIGSSATMGTIVHLSGPTNQFNCANFASLNAGGSLNTGFEIENGSKINIADMTLDGADIGLRVNNVGSGPILQIANLNLFNNVTNSINILHPGTTGFISGSFPTDQAFVDSSATVGLAHSDPDSSSSTGFSVVGDLLQNSTGQKPINLSLLARESSAMGLYGGGVISKNSGFTINISAGFGFLHDNNDIVQQISWDATQITLNAEDIAFITVNQNGIVQDEPNLPTDYTKRIVLGRVVASNSGVTLVERVPISGKHHPNKVEQYLREVFKSIFASGGVPSKGSTAGTINVTQAIYYLGSFRHTTAGASPVTYTKLFRDGSGGYDGVFGQTIVPNDEWDDGSGTIATVPAGEFTKHLLVLDVDEGVQTYALVLSDETYATENDAAAADLPTPPTEFSDSVISIAAVIMQEGVTAVTTILDIRPRPGFAAASTGGVLDHGALTGLSDDDHLIYVPADGSRPFTGDVDHGGNSIINISQVDGVDVSNHSSRHLPNGADPLDNAAPDTNLTANTANQVGIQNSFSRSDHVHSINTGVVSTQTPDQTNAEGTSSNLARADHVHNIPAATAVGLDGSSTNTEGSNSSFARSDHTHAIETGAPSTLNPDQANAEGVSTSFARADHIHNIPVAAAIAITDSTDSIGSAPTFSRSDHTHSHGNRGGGSLHSAVTTSVNGFMAAADKIKLDILRNAQTFYADQLDNPVTADWAVNQLAPAFNDPSNTSLPIRIFANSGNPGVGLIIRIPPNATNMTVGIRGRGQTAPGAPLGVVFNLYRRTISNNSAVTAWSSALALTTISVPTNTNYQYFTPQTITLATLGLTAGNTVQLELTRNSGAGADTYTGNFLLLELDISFS